MSTVTDLFLPVVPEAKFHPYFSRILKFAPEGERDVLRGWANGFEDRDGKFVKEFQTTFNSGFWELYVHASLKQLGLQVDLAYPRPDFLVDGALGPLALEAVVALNPRDLAPDWAKHNPMTDVGLDADRDRFLDLSTLRLAQSIQAKSEKWVKEYSRLPQCEARAFVICVAPFEQPLAQRQGTQGIARVLFGEQQELILTEKSRTMAVGTVSLQEAFKTSGARVELGLFRDARLSHVSGVLFSALATWSKVTALAGDDGRAVKFVAVRLRESGTLSQEITQKSDYIESLLDGLHLFVNPFAQLPLDTKPWSDAGVGVHRLVGPDLIPDSELPDGVLVGRTCIVFSPDAARIHPRGSGAAGDFPAHTISRPRDGEWFGGPASVRLSDRAHLMLHDGWTICVGQDVIDNDWHYLVKRGTYLSMQQFVDEPNRGPKHAAIEVSIASRDEALRLARDWIAAHDLGRWRSSSKKRKRRGKHG